MLDVVLLAVTIWLELCSSHSSSCYHYRHHPCSNKIQNGDIFVLDNIGPPEKWLLNRREREEKEREKIHKYITFFDAVSKPKQISGKSIYHEQGPVPVDDLCLRYGSSVVVDDPVQLDTIRSRLQLTWYVHVALSHGRRRVHAAQNQHVYHNESTGLSVIRLLFHAKAHRQNLRTHTSSSDHVDSRGPLRQPRVATTSLGPFGTNAEWCTVADLLDPWMARASWPSPPTRTKTGASSSAATCDNARWAGVWSSSLTTWPNNEFRLLAMISWTQGRLVRSTSAVFLTKSFQRIPRIIPWERTWKTSSFRISSCRSVYVSEPYNKMDSIQVLYKRSFFCSWSRAVARLCS